ncbi:hypothetical protein [Hyalangium gracile]|uniref:hypothetical protein n=1 Tax=Hyalangium gracile TaxID=394092 RepID=UPI001CC91069|nr:hypothetical protein [Hyalangium gracile]
MAELTLEETRQVQEFRRDEEQERSCDEGRHKAHVLWDWRCAHCWALLHARCGEEIDRCTCPPKVRHG